MTVFGFQVQARDGQARRGRIETAHGPVDTPAFMPVGTAATVKGIQPAQVAATGAQMVLSNTYHLMLRPGAETVEKLGGLHRFMQWPGPILTDSGGFQVMSLAKLRKLDEDGVTFKSHVDGSEHRLTPERAVEIQHLLDSTVTMVLDECTPWPASHAEAASSMELSMRWAARCREAFRAREGYGLFGIVQGSVYPDLRERSARALLEVGFEGYAVGGLAVGEPREEMLRILEATVPALPEDRPRYLMGVGKPGDIVESVLRGIDMFDCVLPTRCGRTGLAFVRRGKVVMKNARHREDPRPLEADCPCPACAGGFSRGYLHHLFRTDEMLGPILLTLHNLTHYQLLTAELRQAIEAGRLEEYVAWFRAEQAKGDLPPL
jgi:queuine tRNA-ribosyltransferase